MVDAAKNFELATEEVRKADLAKISNDDKLALYGFFKQATEGDVNTSNVLMETPVNSDKRQARNI